MSTSNTFESMKPNFKDTYGKKGKDFKKIKDKVGKKPCSCSKDCGCKKEIIKEF